MDKVEQPKSKDVEKPSNEDLAAYEYRRQLPIFDREITGLTGNEAKQVIQAIMQYPLEKTDFHWTRPEVQRAFITGATIMDCRFVLMKAVLELSADQKKSILDEFKASEEQKSPPKEEANVSV